MQDLVLAVDSLHEYNFSHNDIRPSNIFYSKDKKKYILCNYDSATLCGNKPIDRLIRSSVHYNSPEMNQSEKYLQKKSDVYSLGVTLLCAFFLCEPIDLGKAAKFHKSYKSNKYYSLIMSML